jgi:signal transduction histidine kinase
LTTVLCLTLLLLTNLGLAYVDESPDAQLTAWLLPARIVDSIQILRVAPESDRSTIAARLSTASLQATILDKPVESTGAIENLQNSKVGRLIQSSLDADDKRLTGGDEHSTALGRGFSLRVSSLGTDNFLVQVPLSQEQWAILSVHLSHYPYSAWLSVALPACVSLLIICALSILAARILAKPIADFSHSAELFGLGIDVSPLREQGPRELRAATRAFNRMQARLKGFIEDRTQMLAAMSHDLRTPLARLRLRAEFIENEEQRGKIHHDLNAMSDMIKSVLGFARDDAQREQSALVDLGVIVADICDDLSETGAAVSLVGSRHIDVLCRPVAIRRAITNLIENAVKYGGGARVELVRKQQVVWVVIDDDGPGIPVHEQERVFVPFHRLEQSRNQDTGGVGLGLSVARSIAKEHGGDVTLSNRLPTGLRAQLQLPA